MWKKTTEIVQLHAPIRVKMHQRGSVLMALHVKLMYDYVTEKSKEDINNISNQLYTQQQQKWTQKLVFDLFPDMG